jgi:hypothetical protein
MTRRFGLWPVLALLLPILTPASAALADAGAEICERAIARGAARTGVPQEVLHAISLTETGRPLAGRLRPWPWAINREGRGHWFATREEALAFARASVAARRPSFDVGCFQINYRYHGMNFASVEEMFDPDVGAIYAAQFLRSFYRGNWSVAAGSYHSQTPARASVYRARFDRILAGLGGGPAIAIAEAPDAPTAEPAKPRKSRTRLSRGPKIITIPKKAPAPTEEAALGDGRAVLATSGPEAPNVPARLF